jgi:hypothetical protein
MTDAFLLDAYQAFLESPTPENYRRVRRITVALPGFDRQSLAWLELSRLCDEARHEEVLRRADEMWTAWRLHPRYHLLVGYAASHLGDEEEVELSRFQFQTCLDALLETGEGSRTSPYQVLRTCDQYDIIRFLGLRGRSQRAVEIRGRSRDVVQCDDGSRVWFDLGPVRRPGQRSRRVSRWVDRTANQVLHHF